LKSEATKPPRSVKVFMSVSLNFFAYLNIETLKTLEGKFTKIVTEVFRGWLSDFFVLASVHFKTVWGRKNLHSNILLRKYLVCIELVSYFILGYFIVVPDRMYKNETKVKTVRGGSMVYTEVLIFVLVFSFCHTNMLGW